MEHENIGRNWGTFLGVSCYEGVSCWTVEGGGKWGVPRSSWILANLGFLFDFSEDIRSLWPLSEFRIRAIVFVEVVVEGRSKEESTDIYQRTKEGYEMTTEKSLFLNILTSHALISM